MFFLKYFFFCTKWKLQYKLRNKMNRMWSAKLRKSKKISCKEISNSCNLLISQIKVRDAFLMPGVIQEKTCSLIVSRILLKHRNSNFTLVEATFVWKERTCTSKVTPKGFFLHIHTYFRMTVSEEESPLRSVKIFEHLNIIVTKEVSYNTDVSDDFTNDRKQKCSSNHSALVIALKEHMIAWNHISEINSLSLSHW